MGWVPYAAFLAFMITLLAFDLRVASRSGTAISPAKALRWTMFFVSIALGFAAAIYWMYENHWMGLGLGVPMHGGTSRDVAGLEALTLYLTGYLVEYSLSVDNLFVIALIMAHFQIPPRYQHRVLLWGILGAIAMRGFMIAVGAAIVTTFHWVIYIFAAFLLYAGWKMLRSDGDEEVDLERTKTVRLARRILPVSTKLDEGRFLTEQAGKLAATPLLLALVVIELTDLVFAVDSIPAIFNITMDPFIVFTSNMFAVLGLRSLFFALAGLLRQFKYLKYSVGIVLLFVGVKMLAEHWYRPPAWATLAFIALCLAAGIVASLLAKPASTSEPAAAGEEPPGPAEASRTTSPTPAESH